MADYYPLIARAVGTLNPNTPEQRRALYDRARRTLVDQLRIKDPTLTQTDVKAESAALDAAIQRVERDFARPAAPPPPRPRPRPGPPPAHAVPDEPPGYGDLSPLADTGKRWRLLIGAGVAALLIIGGVVAYSYMPRNLSAVRSDMHTMATAQKSAAVAAAETPEDKSNYVRMRQLVYYRTNQPVGTLVVDLRDPATRQPVFRVRVDTPIDTEPDKLEANINAAVAAMFAKYPTAAASKR